MRWLITRENYFFGEGAGRGAEGNATDGLASCCAGTSGVVALDEVGLMPA